MRIQTRMLSHHLRLIQSMRVPVRRSKMDMSTFLSRSDQQKGECWCHSSRIMRERLCHSDFRHWKSQIYYEGTNSIFDLLLSPEIQSSPYLLNKFCLLSHAIRDCLWLKFYLSQFNAAITTVHGTVLSNIFGGKILIQVLIKFLFSFTFTGAHSGECHENIKHHSHSRLKAHQPH